MENLIPLQRAMRKHTKLQKLRHKVERRVNRSSVAFSSVKTEVKSLLQASASGVRHEPKDSPESYKRPINSMDAVSTLKSLVGPLRQRREGGYNLPKYVKCHQVTARGLRVVLNDADYFNFPEEDEFKEEMFHLVGLIQNSAIHLDRM